MKKLNYNKIKTRFDNFKPQNDYEKWIKSVISINLNDAKTGSQASKIACLSECDFYLREVGQ